MEAINSDKSCDKINDLLWLKLCNANIHTYTFMLHGDPHSKKRNPLQHMFTSLKQRPRDATSQMTPLPSESLSWDWRPAHSLATCIYEKGPQMLTDAILEVEKLNAVQQLTATIIPPSMVNVMSHEEEHCFQFQKQGHITWNCPHIRCYKCDIYGHIVMDCLHKIPSSGTPAINHKPPRSHHSRSSSRHHHEERDGQSQLRLHSHFQRHCTLSHHNSYRGHSRLQHWDKCSHHRSSSWWSHSIYRGYNHQLFHVTHHTNLITDHPHIEVLQLTNPEITVDHAPDLHTNLQGRTYTDQVHIPVDHKGKHTSRRTWGWKLRICTQTITALMITPVTQERNLII